MTLTLRVQRHRYMNDLVWRAITKTGIPSIKEQHGLATHQTVSDREAGESQCNLGRDMSHAPHQQSKQQRNANSANTLNFLERITSLFPLDLLK